MRVVQCVIMHFMAVVITFYDLNVNKPYAKTYITISRFKAVLFSYTSKYWLHIYQHSTYKLSFNVSWLQNHNQNFLTYFTCFTNINTAQNDNYNHNNCKYHRSCDDPGNLSEKKKFKIRTDKSNINQQKVLIP